MSFTFFSGSFSLLRHILFLSYLDKVKNFCGCNIEEGIVLHVYFDFLCERMKDNRVNGPLIPLKLFQT